MNNRGPVLACAGLTSLAIAAAAQGAIYSVAATDDVELDVELPGTNLNASLTEFEGAGGESVRLSLIPGTGTTNGARAEYLIFRWDSFGVGPGEVAAGPGTFTFAVYNTLNVPSNPTTNFGDYTIHEIVGGASTWDETTVTPNSLLAGGTDLAALFGPALDIGQAGTSGDPSPATDNSLTIPQAVVQRLIDGTSSGLAILPTAATNFQGRPHEFGVPGTAPTLAFETAVPEPAGFALIGLGALGLLRRRR